MMKNFLQKLTGLDSKAIALRFVLMFGVVKDYVPALMEYIKKYGVALNFNSRLVKIDGPAKKAWFEVTKDDKKETIERSFDMIHVCPPQLAPDFDRSSPLADKAGWMSTKTRCKILVSRVFSASSTPAPHRTPRPPRRPASKRRSHLWRLWIVPIDGGAMAVNCFRPSPNG
jgi:hypothetical protein